jgi:hypothetical protein
LFPDPIIHRFHQCLLTVDTWRQSISCPLTEKNCVAT